MIYLQRYGILVRNHIGYDNFTETLYWKLLSVKFHPIHRCRQVPIIIKRFKLGELNISLFKWSYILFYLKYNNSQHYGQWKSRWLTTCSRIPAELSSWAAVPSSA